MNTRPATKSDIASLILLAQQFHAEDPAFSNLPFDSSIVERSLTEYMLSQCCCLLVAEVEERVCGFFMGHVSDSLWGRFSEAFEDFFYIQADYRCHSAGVRLLADYVQWAEERGALIKGAGIRSRINEQAAFTLLGRAGFVPFGTLWVYRGH